MTRPDGALTHILDQLATLVDGRDRSAVIELSERLRKQHLRLLVVGAAKRGKSTLINALLGRPLLPTGVIPLTSVATTVAFGDNEHLEATFTDGRHETLPLTSLEDLVTERGNPHNRRGVASVMCRVAAPLLAGGVELVDTPGTGSIHEHNTDEAAGALRSMDAAVFVVSADPPISAGERAWLRKVSKQAVRVFCVLNKADYLTRDELAEAVEFTRNVVSEELGKAVEVFPVSARTALAAEGDPDAADRNWRSFCATFNRYLAGGGGSDLATSVTSRAARLAAGTVEQQSATLATLALAEEQLDARLASFTLELRKVESSRFEGASVAKATFERLLRETAEQGQALVSTAGPVVQSQVADRFERLDGALRDVEDAALRLAAEQIRGVVDEWRAVHATWLADQLAALDEDLRTRVDEHVQRVRDAAAAAFDLDLVALPPAQTLVESGRFSYAFGSDIGQVEALAAAVRTHLPGQLGRHRVAQYVTDRTYELLDRQAGRARADFIERLRETQRQTLRTLDDRFDAGAGRIAEAVNRAAQQRRAATVTVEKLRSDARRHRDAAQELVDELQSTLTATSVERPS